MAGIYAFAAVALLLGGAAIGVVTVVSLAIRREDRDYSLTRDIPDRGAQGARRINGVGIRGLDWLTNPTAAGVTHDRPRN